MPKIILLRMASGKSVREADESSRQEEMDILSQLLFSSLYRIVFTSGTICNKWEKQINENYINECKALKIRQRENFTEKTGTCISKISLIRDDRKTRTLHL
ncbi:hypothetical protein BaRGS_00016894, partial [Batillaria attramentaria]